MTNKIKNNGIYNTFYSTIDRDLIVNQNDFYDNLEINEELLLKNANYSIDDFNDEDEFIEEVRSDFMERLHYLPQFFSPVYEQDFDEQIAFDCGLLPFKYITEYKDYNLLALGGVGTDLSPRLEAYQAIIDGSVDEESNLLSSYNNYQDYYLYILGSKIFDQILDILNIKKSIKLNNIVEV